MSELMQLINSLALPVMVLLAFGVMFGVVRIKSILFYLLALLLLPFLFSAISQAFRAGFTSGAMDWKTMLVMIFIGLIVIRLFIDRVFRR